MASIPTQNTLLDIIEISKKSSEDMMKILDDPIEKNIIRLDNIAVATMMVLRADEMITIINAQAKNIKGSSAEQAMASVNEVVEFIKDFNEPLGDLINGFEAIIKQAEKFDSQNTGGTIASLFAILDDLNIQKIAKYNSEKLKNRLDIAHQVLAIYSEFLSKTEPVLKVLIISAVAISTLLDKFYDLVVSISKKITSIIDTMMLKDISLLAMILAEYKIMMLYWISTLYCWVVKRIVNELKDIKINVSDKTKITLITNVLQSFITFAVMASAINVIKTLKNLLALNMMLSKNGAIRRLLTNIIETFKEISFVDIGKTIIGIVFIGGILYSVKKLIVFLADITISDIIGTVITLLLIKSMVNTAINVVQNMASNVHKLVKVDTIILSVGLIALKYIFILVNTLMETISRIAIGTMIMNLYRLFVMARVMTSISKNLIISHDAIKNLQQHTGINNLTDAAKFQLKLLVTITILKLIDWLFVAASKIKLGFFAKRRIKGIGKKVQLITSQLELAIAEIENICTPITKKTHIIIATIIGVIAIFAAMGAMFAMISITSLPAMMVPVAAFFIYLSIKAIIKLLKLTGKQLKEIDNKQSIKDTLRILALIGEVSAMAVALSTSGGAIVMAGIRSTVITPSIVLVSIAISAFIWFIKRLNKTMSSFDFIKSTADTAKVITLIGQIATTAVALSKAGVDIAAAGLKSILIIAALPLILLAIAGMKYLLIFSRKLLADRRIRNYEKTILEIQSIISSILTLSKSLVAIAAASIAATAAVTTTIALMGVIVVLLITIRLMASVTKNISPIRTCLTMLQLIVLIGIIGVLAVELYLLGLVAKIATPMLSSAGILLLGILAFTAILALVGLLLVPIQPGIIAAGLCIGVVAITVAFVVVSVLLITSALKLLEQIELNPDAILENVNVVIDTVSEIIKKVFGIQDNDEKGNSKSFWKSLLDWLGASFKGAFMAVAAASAMTIIVLTAISVGAVLIIASMLTLIQKLDISKEENKKAILDNVKAVIEVVNQIINSIFDDSNINTSSKNGGLLGGIINFVNPKFSPILNAIFAVAYLAMALIATSVILMIVGELKLLQKIGFDKTKVINNVTSVFDVVKKIMSVIYHTPEDNSTEAQNGGVLGSIIGFFSPGLKTLTDAIMGIAYLALSIAAISMVAGIAGLLKLFEKPMFNKESVIANVNDIFETVEAISKKIFEPEGGLLPESKNKGVFGSIIDFFSPNLAKVTSALTCIAQLGTIMAAISTVKGIGEQLKAIMDIHIDIPTSTKRINEILDASAKLSETIFSTEAKIKFPVPEEEKRSVFGALIDWTMGTSDEDKSIRFAMKKIDRLGVIAAAVGALGNIQSNIVKIMEANPEDISIAISRVKSIMDASAELASAIFASDIKFNLPTPSNDDVLSALVDLGFNHWYGSSKAEKARATQEAQIKSALKRVEILGIISSALGSITTIIDYVKTINETKVVNVKSAQEKVTTLITTANGIANEILNGEYSKTIMDSKNSKDIKKYSNTISKIIQDLANNINQIANIPVGKFKQGLETIRLVDDTVAGFAKVTDTDVKNSKELTENYIKFFKQVNGMDLKKLQHTDWLMRSWASISRDLKGDFEGLAKTINANIMPLLEKVNDTMDKATKCQEQIINELTKPVDLNGISAGGGSNMSTGFGSFGSGGSGYNGSNNPSNIPDSPSTTPEPASSEKGRSIPVMAPTTAGDEPKAGKKYVVEFATIKEQ